MAKVLIAGQMIGCILDSLITTKCTEEESSHGPMAGHMKANTIMIKSKERVYTHGRMDENMMASG